MATSWSAVREGEPVDAEYEAGPAAGGLRSRGPPRAAPGRRRVGFVDLIVGCGLAALAGAICAVAVAGSGSGGETGPLALDIAALKREAAAASAAQEQAADDLARLRALVAAQSDRIEAREAAEADLQRSAADLAGQVSALGGAPGNAGALASLLTRLDRLEARLAADAAAPQTAPQVAAGLRDLSERIAALDADMAGLVRRLELREADVARLDRGLAEARARLALSSSSQPDFAAALPGPPPRIAEALAQLETAALRGQPFPREQGQLASLAPLDPDIAALAPLARAGAPNAEQLRRSFEAAARPILARIEARTADEGYGWFAAAFTGQALERTEARPQIAAARTMLARNDLRAAEAAPLPAEFAAWREALRRRLALDARLERLHAR